MSLVKFEKNQHIATLTLNVPDQLNAMSVDMGGEFKNHLETISQDKDIRVVVLTGEGRAFSSGGNLDMLEAKLDKSEKQNEEDLKNFYKMFLEIRNIPQPVIAKLNGHAVGAGFCLSLACDLKIASAKAKMGANFAKLGLAPGMGGTYLITRLVGPVKAAEILYTGKIFTADEAFDYGLLNQVVDPDKLDQTVAAIAHEIASNGPVAIRHIKRGIQIAMDHDLETIFDYDSKAQASCFESSDIREGIQAIREKRPPVFRGE